MNVSVIWSQHLMERFVFRLFHGIGISSFFSVSFHIMCSVCTQGSLIISDFGEHIAFECEHYPQFGCDSFCCVQLQSSQRHSAAVSDDDSKRRREWDRGRQSSEQWTVLLPKLSSRSPFQDRHIADAAYSNQRNHRHRFTFGSGKGDSWRPTVPELHNRHYVVRSG